MAIHGGLSETELAVRWGVSRRTLQRWRKTRRGPAFLRLGGRITYLLDDIEAFEHACRIEPQHSAQEDSP